MLTFEEKLAKYAELLIGLGVNLQKGQYLLLDIDAENYPLARALSHEAFQRGAKDVIIHVCRPGARTFRHAGGFFRRCAVGNRILRGIHPTGRVFSADSSCLSDVVRGR